MNREFCYLGLFLLFICLCSEFCNPVKCKEMTSEFRKLIEDEFNYCEIDSDCKIARGICPLGCFFIIHEENEVALDSLKRLVGNNCTRCVYKCVTPPKKLKCLQNQCFPEFEDRFVYFLFGVNCEKIAEIYESELVGKPVAEIDFHLLDYEIIEEDSIENFTKGEKREDNNLKIFVDATGKIDSIRCYEK